eukprot:CAMPEP_0176237796 /NCGR_PEP_ID=MMETSP0121_2-20121125/28033_1 /TAXON_ID=160619 /ORGANISM="Kryptoperidinium foliaceum, Strain CCMP 1326" /LENGTH=74 /DNA_ID=CAMNT_0017577249 /DNA_START=32 /DNA_END=252 /DNA_ORIENTATION=+
MHATCAPDQATANRIRTELAPFGAASAHLRAVTLQGAALPHQLLDLLALLLDSGLAPVDAVANVRQHLVVLVDG